MDEFIEKTKRGEKSFIRVYNNFNGEIIITDVNFENGIYYTDTRDFSNERKYHDTYKKLEKERNE